MERLEVAILVEDVVGRKQRLAEPLVHRSAVEQHGAVEERPPFVGSIRLRQADEHRRHRSHVGGELAGRAPARVDESWAEQQIARQVADERELRRHGEIGAEPPGLGERVDNQSRVARQIADGRIDLQKRDLHRRNVTRAPRGEDTVRPYSVKRYFSNTHRAPNPARHVIFFPCSYPRPA